MKTKFKDIKIIKYKEPGGGGTGGTGPTPPPPPKPDNVEEISDEQPPDDPTKKKPGEEEREDPKYKEIKDYDPSKGKGTFNPGEILRPGDLGDFGGDDGIEEDKPKAEEIADTWEKIVGGAAGNMPASIKRALERLKRPVIDWRSALEEYVDDAISKSKYDLPSRRFLSQGDVQYGYKSYKEDLESIVVAIDTSGSISREMITQFLSEVVSIGETYGPQKTVILYCDTKVYEPDILEPGDRPDFNKIAGGGGTNFWPPFKWVEKNMLENGEMPTVFIYFTDGEATFPTENDYGIESYSDRCIWVFLTFNGEPYPNPQPFGRRIDIALQNKTITTI
jgi:hypothetical protein